MEINHSSQENVARLDLLNSVIASAQFMLLNNGCTKRDVSNLLGVALDISNSIGVQFLHDEMEPQHNINSPSIGNRIREIRKARDITQKDIAERVGVTAGCVTQWESDLISPNCDKLIPLAKALGCDPLWLLGK